MDNETGANTLKAALEALLKALTKLFKKKSLGKLDQAGEDEKKTSTCYNSTSKERLDQTPSDGDRGYWAGERGESMYIPTDQGQKDILQKHKVDGIIYKDSIPDFLPVSVCTVEIDSMTDNRNSGKNSNFAQCNKKTAKEWTKQQRDGRNWSEDDVENWREANKYTWHERNDMKTCDLVPRSTNKYFCHLGGVSEYKRRESFTPEEDFDE